MIDWLENPKGNANTRDCYIYLVTVRSLYLRKQECLADTSPGTVIQQLSNMEINLRPQWRYWTFSQSRAPVCGRCGLAHPKFCCRANNQRCLRCDKIGHFARMCKSKLTNTQKPEKPSKVHQKSDKKRTRDQQRLERYIQTKHLLRELPFSNIRDNNFRNTFNTNCILKQELTNTKRKCRQEQKASVSIIQELREQLKLFGNEILELKQQNETLKSSKETNVIIDLYQTELFNLRAELTQKNNTIEIMSVGLQKTCLEHNKELENERSLLEKMQQGKDHIMQELLHHQTIINSLEIENQELLDQNLHLSNLLHQNYPYQHPQTARNYYPNHPGSGRRQCYK